MRVRVRVENSQRSFMTMKKLCKPPTVSLQISGDHVRAPQAPTIPVFPALNINFGVFDCTLSRAMLAGWRVFTHLNAHSGLAARRFSTSSPRYFQDYYLTRSLGGKNPERSGSFVVLNVSRLTGQLLRLNLNKSRQLLGMLFTLTTGDTLY